MSPADKKIATKIWPQHMRTLNAKLYVRQRAALKALGDKALAYDPQSKRNTK